MKTFSKKQAQDFLFNKRVFVSNKSENIQKIAIAAGYQWGESPTKEVKNLDKPFLFFGRSKKSDKLLITFTSDINKFNNSSKTEINASDITDIKVQKTEADIYAEGYAAGFRDAEEGEDYDDTYVD
jgi:hypothetical protein